jgi:hypothetical protein
MIEGGHMAAFYRGNRADGKGYFSILSGLICAVEQGQLFSQQDNGQTSFSTVYYKNITEIFICQIKLFENYLKTIR